HYYAITGLPNSPLHDALPIYLRLELIEQLRRKLAALDGRLDLAFDDVRQLAEPDRACHPGAAFERVQAAAQRVGDVLVGGVRLRSGEDTSELQSRLAIVCRLL